MKQFLYILILSTFIPVCKAEWFESNTRHRLEVKPAPPGKTFFVELENKILPVSIDKGVSVFSDKGKAAPFYFSRDRKKLFIHSLPEDKLFHIYFGFDKRQPSNKWQKDIPKVTQEKRLELFVKKVKLYNERFYMINNDGLLELAEYCFNSPPHIQKIQEMNSKINTLRYQIRKMDRDRGRTNAPVTAPLKRQRENIEKQISKLKQQVNDAEKNLSKEERKAQHYRRISSSYFSKKAATMIKMANTKFDKLKKYDMLGARFTGQLYIQKSGEYEFAINSKDSSLLTIDGKIVAGWPGKHSPSRGWQKNGKVELSPGLHKLAFYYFSRGKKKSALAAWKKPGDKKFQILQENDFYPAYPSKITQCTNKEGQSFPIISFTLNGYFLLDKGRKADWINCWVDPNNMQNLKWMSDGTLVSNTNSSSYLKIRGEDSNLYLASGDKKFNDIPIKTSGAKNNSKRYDPDIELKIWTPSFIYDEEILDMDFEMVSGLPRESNTLLKTTLSRPVCFLKASSRFLKLEGKQAYDRNARFCPPSRQKETIEIVGSELKNGLDIAFYLMIPPVIFSEQKIRFVPINECAGITETVDGLMDDKGKRVIPILHRPSLAEKRTWSLSKTIINELSPTKKLLVIADDFGLNGKSFREQLKKRLESQKIKMEFIPWNNQKIGSTIRGSIGQLIPKIQQTDADRLLIVPPAEDINTGIPVRTQTRGLAALTQIAHNNKNIRLIYASSPFPSLQKTKLDSELTESVKKMAKDYNIEFFDMNTFIRNKPNWRQTYRFNQHEDLLYEPYPVHSTEEISQKIFDSL